MMTMESSTNTCAARLRFTHWLTNEVGNHYPNHITVSQCLGAPISARDAGLGHEICSKWHKTLIQHTIMINHSHIKLLKVSCLMCFVSVFVSRWILRSLPFVRNILPSSIPRYAWSHRWLSPKHPFYTSWVHGGTIATATVAPFVGKQWWERLL